MSMAWILRMGNSPAKIDVSYWMWRKSTLTRIFVQYYTSRNRIILADLQKKPGRKRNKYYNPSRSQTRTCPSFSKLYHFSSYLSVQKITSVVDATHKKAKKVDSNVIIDLNKTDRTEACFGFVGKACRINYRRVLGVRAGTIPWLIRRFRFFSGRSGCMKGKFGTLKYYI